ncbi:MAG: hypothetical protein ABI723_20520 [Bacteroidia bacterium]
MMKKVFLFFLLIISCDFIDAQSFRYEAKVDVVDSSGFYKIYLAPEINSKLKEGFIDLRLFDNEEKETPYDFAIDEIPKTNRKFIEYEIIENKLLKDSVTIITLRNKSKSKIDNISLQIKNAEVDKQIKLSGSDDRLHWYVVKEYAEFNSINNTSDVSEIKLIDFPLSNYEYYRIEINDKNSKPLNILSAGYNESITNSAPFTEISPPNIIDVDSIKTKTTWVHIPIYGSSIIDFIIINVASPKYFLRSVDEYAVSINKGRPSERVWIDASVINSAKQNKIRLPYMVDEFVLCIHNEDNPPLKISSIKCFQYNRYALAYLEKSKSYTFRFGNDSIAKPTYDLKYFQNIIPADVRIIKTQAVKKNKQPQQTPPKEPYTFFTDKKFIWVVVGLIIVFLGVITFRMLRE